jgi:hypothetical protein
MCESVGLSGIEDSVNPLEEIAVEGIKNLLLTRRGSIY